MHTYGVRPLMGLIQGVNCSRAIDHVWLRIEPGAHVAELTRSECNGRRSAAFLIFLPYPASLYGTTLIEDSVTTSINCTALSYASMTVQFRWELPGQNVSCGDGFYVNNCDNQRSQSGPSMGFIQCAILRMRPIQLLLGCPS